MNRHGLIWAIVVVGVLLTVGFLLSDNEEDKEAVMLANPASSYCIDQGYELKIRQNENGSYRVCVSSTGQECGEWSYFWGNCDLNNDERCVPASCCHAVSCVWESEALACDGMFCAEDCEIGTMDCGQGRCGIVDGKCGVIWNE